MNDIKEKLKDEISEMKNEIRARTVGYILAAFGLVAGLAWNDAIKALIEYVFPADQAGDTLKAKFAYALAITVVVVVVSGYLARLSRKSESASAKLPARKRRATKSE